MQVVLFAPREAESGLARVKRLADGEQTDVPIDELDFGASVFQAAGKVLTVAGWGTLSSSGPSPDTPRRVDVPVVSNEECNEATAYGGLILDGMICAGNLSEGGVDACQGDSGGPMWGVDDRGSHVLTGIVSWGIG